MVEPVAAPRSLSRQVLADTERAQESTSLEQARLRDVGSRLKTLRRIGGFSLQHVADTVGISASFLSMLERGQTDISLNRIARLAAFYGMNLSELLLEGDPQPDADVVPFSDLRLIERGTGVRYRLIRRDHPQVVHVELDPFSTFSSMTAHRGEDFWMILHGTAVLLYGSKRLDLAAPTTARFSGTIPHGWENPYTEPVELVAVTTVPYW